MRDDTHNEPGTEKKILSGKLLLIFFGGMLLLTFFSNTINNYTLPRVKVEYPSSGELVKEIMASGEITPRLSQSEYTDLSARVSEVYVRPGDMVSKGQLIMSLDKTQAQRSFREEDLNLRKLKLAEETSANGALGSHSLARKQALAWQKFEAARNDCERMQRLFDAGAESAVALETAKNQLKTSEWEYQQAREDYEQGIKKAAYDIMAQELKVASLKQDLETKYDIRAKCSGIVKEVNFSPGSPANSAKPLFVITDQNQGYEFKITIDNELAAYLTPGDEFMVDIKSMRGSLNGKVARMVNGSGGTRDVYLDVRSASLMGGEAGQAFISKNIGFYDCLVSNQALGKDAGTYFVWVIEERQGAFKNDLILKKARVSVINSDGSKAALQNSLDQYQRIVCGVEGSRSLTEGCRVQLSE